MFEIIFTKILVVHIIAAMIAVGTVTVTDYLHILSLKDRKFEQRILVVFPHLSKLIVLSLIAIYISGVLMVMAKPEIMQSSLFWVKLSLVVLVTINGALLHHYMIPKIEKALKQKEHPKILVRQAAFGGSLSIVSWYSIVILAMTKNLGYTPLQFIVAYFLALAIVFLIALRVEAKRMRW